MPISAMAARQSTKVAASASQAAARRTARTMKPARVRRGPNRSSDQPTGNCASAKAANQIADSAAEIGRVEAEVAAEVPRDDGEEGAEELAQRIGDEEDEEGRQASEPRRRTGNPLRSRAGQDPPSGCSAAPRRSGQAMRRPG